MAKKIKSELRRADWYNKATDKTEVRFYDGRKRATENQVKQYIKQNYNKLNQDKLSKDDAAYLGRVKGGHNRQRQAIRIDGKYVNKAFFDNPNNPIQWQKLAEQKGYKSVQELFNNDHDLYEKARNNYNSDNGLPYIYYSENILHYMDTFGGKFFINENPGNYEKNNNPAQMTKIKAMAKIDFTDKHLKRQFGAFTNQYDVSYRRGYTALHLNIPFEYTIEEYDLPEDFNDLETGVTVINSDTEEVRLKRELKKLKKNNVKDGRFTYHYKGKEKKGKSYKTVTGTFKARSIQEARSMAKNQVGGNGMLINVERKSAVKRPKKK